MAAVINTNIASLNAQRNLNTSQTSLATSLQRLSTGLRINSAKDDAAGMAISERFTTQIRGLNQAARNANDGISLAQTAEGSMVEVSNNLQRIRELAVQSANATNSTSDRQALQAEVTQLVQEIDRVANQTEFNGLKLLNGDFSSQAFQIGANAGQTITVSSLANARTSALGQSYEAKATGSTAVTAALQAGDLTINTKAIVASTAGTGGPANGLAADSANRIAAAINSSQSDVSATANATVTTQGTTVASSAGTMGATAAGTLTINGVALSFAAGEFADANSIAQNQTAILNKINGVSAATGVSARTGTTGIELVGADGRNIDVAVSGAAGGFSVANMGLTAAATTSGTITLNSTNGEAITLGGNNETRAGFTDGQVINRVAGGTSIAQIDISDSTGAAAAIASVDAALKTISSSRADLGAIQNRFSSVVANLQTTSENLSASRSRIQDTDFAAETANLTRGQILQQAGTAMLAQANSLPNGVLALLRG
jgi:flagellin